MAAPTGAAPWPDVQPLAVATRGYYASTRQLQETPSILRRLSRRLRTIRPTPPAARAAPIPTTRAVAPDRWAVTAGTWKWRVLWFFGRWSAGPGLRSIPLPESVDVGLRLPKEGGPTAYANSVSAVSIITVVTVDDVLFPSDKGEPAAAAGWWCGDVHVLVDSALPHSADLEANRGAVLRGDRRCLGIGHVPSSGVRVRHPVDVV